MNRFLALSMIAAVAACVDDGGNVRIDMGALVERAAQSTVPLERLVLTVTGSGIDAPIIAELDFDDPIFELEIPAGPQRRFLVEGFSTDGFPLFWGERITAVDARSDEEIVIPAFPAGRLDLSVALFGEDTRPEELLVRIVAVAPRVDQREELVADAFSDVSVTLPTGDHELRVSTIDGLSQIPEVTTITVTQGVAVATELRLLASDACAPVLGSTPDLDQDGLACDVDCDDTNPNCGLDCTDADADGFCIDQDCDDTAILGAPCQDNCASYFTDADADGFGDDTTEVVACAAPAGLVPTGGDCDDANPGCGADCTDRDGDTFCAPLDCDDTNRLVSPERVEVVADGIDSNCDGLEFCYVDVDNDREGDRTVPPVSSASLDCSEAGVSRRGADCDDDDPTRTFLDVDGDGFFSCVDIDGFDCDDSDPSVHSIKLENCLDGIDNDCDGAVDFFDTECIDFFDPDLDGFNESFNAFDSLQQNKPIDTFINLGGSEDDGPIWDADNDGMSVSQGDCDDTNPAVKLGAPLNCNSPASDSNCDGVSDLAQCGSCVDMDNDGYCGNLPDQDRDCDDTDATLNLDDLDGDGLTTCSEDPIADCDDTSRIVPIPLDETFGLFEFCFDGLDNDCDGLVDFADADDCGCPDNDGDGFLCADCDDDPSTGGDCFDASQCSVQLEDRDGDLYTNADGNTRLMCNSFSTLGAGDCDDDDPTINPGAIETCNDAIDSNCVDGDNDRDADRDGVIDVACGGSDCDDADFNVGGDDIDGDSPVAVCEDPAPFDFFINADNVESCDGIDNDGNGFVDDIDAQDDGDEIPYCEDNCPTVFNLDQSDVDVDGIGDACDCDLVIDTDECPTTRGCTDDDGDGFWAAGGACTPVPGLADCIDNPDVGRNANPLRAEFCGDLDGLDNDCDGLADEEDSDCRGLSADVARPVAVAFDPISGEPTVISEVKVPMCNFVLEPTLPSPCGAGVDVPIQYLEVLSTNPGDLAAARIQNTGDRPMSVVRYSPLSGALTDCVIDALPPGGSVSVFPQSGTVAVALHPEEDSPCGGGPFDLELQVEAEGFISSVFEDRDKDRLEDNSEDPCIDVDGDGYGAEGPFGVNNCPLTGIDCDDSDPSSFPGATERCDGRDNNCNNEVDEGFSYGAALLLDEDFESGDGGFSVETISGNNDWQLTTTFGGGSLVFSSTRYGTDGAFDGSPEHSALQSPSFPIPVGETILLQFDSYASNAGGCPGDGRDGEVLEWFDGASWQPIVSCPTSPLNDEFASRPFDRFTFPVPLGETQTSLRVRWRFDSGEPLFTDGWYIDNVKVYSCTPN